DRQKADFFIDQLPVANPRTTPRVVTQSIAAGTQVAKGTVVNLVLAPKQTIPWTIFENAHADLAGKTVDFLDDVVDDPNVGQVVLKYDTAGDVPTADRKVLTDAFTRKGLPVNDADPTRSFGAAFDSARAAAAYR